jgi:hypothetical protein
MIKQVLIRLAIVLSVGWSLFVIWFSYSIAPGRDTFRIAWDEPWVPPAEDRLVDLPPWEEYRTGEEHSRLGDQMERASRALRNAQAAGDAQAVETLTKYVRDLELTADSIRREDLAAAIGRRDQARKQVRDYLVLTILGWGIPVVAVWSMVWIAAPLSRGSQPER